jgi:hypothetical protein
MNKLLSVKVTATQTGSVAPESIAQADTKNDVVGLLKFVNRRSNNPSRRRFPPTASDIPGRSSERRGEQNISLPWKLRRSNKISCRLPILFARKGPLTGSRNLQENDSWLMKEVQIQNLLFVCSRNKLRSLTAEKVFEGLRSQSLDELETATRVNTP